MEYGLKLDPAAAASKDDPKVGDIVTLKSGGPQMTVTGVTKDGAASAVNCKWWSDKRDVFDSHQFPLDVLNRAGGDSHPVPKAPSEEPPVEEPPPVAVPRPRAK
jgi:uncharacterized protein YodC (DUF2158 family)